MFDGLLVIVPPPLSLTVRVKSGTNVAVTDFAELIVTVQLLPLPLQAPLQPEKVQPLGGVAVRLTFV